MFSYFPSDEKVELDPAKFIKHAVDIAEHEFEGRIPDIEKLCKEKQLTKEETKAVLIRVKSSLTEIAIGKALNEIKKFRLKQDEEDLADYLSKKRKIRDSEDRQARDKIEEAVDSYLQKHHDKLKQGATSAGLSEEETKNVFQKTAADSKYKLLNFYQDKVSKIDKELAQQDLKEAISNHLIKCMEDLFKEHVNIYSKHANVELKANEVTNLLLEALYAAKVTIKQNLQQEFVKINSELDAHKQLRRSI